MGISRGILSTDLQYKEWKKAFDQKNKSVQLVTTELSESETRIINAALDKYNKRMCKRYKLKNLPAGIEIR